MKHTVLNVIIALLITENVIFLNFTLLEIQKERYGGQSESRKYDVTQVFDYIRSSRKYRYVLYFLDEDKDVIEIWAKSDEHSKRFTEQIAEDGLDTSYFQINIDWIVEQ